MQLTVSGVKKEYEEGITLPKLLKLKMLKHQNMLQFQSTKNLFQETRKKHTS